MTITHVFVSSEADGPDENDIRISNWNAAHAITLDSLTDGSNKLILNGTNWEFWVGGTRVAFIDSSGNLHIKGVIITEDGGV